MYASGVSPTSWSGGSQKHSRELRPHASWGRPPVVGEAFWLLGLFAVSIGPPFFALAANAPLLQAWFARTDHPSANDPYFLYAASNIGSFLALLSYPILIEPMISLTAQTWLWAAGFIVLILLIAACGYLLWQSPDKAPTAVPATYRPGTLVSIVLSSYAGAPQSPTSFTPASLNSVLSCS